MGHERRRHPRIQVALPVAVEAGGDGQGGLQTQTRNISSRGAYFEVSRPIPELTRLEVTLCVPSGSAESHQLHCGGVVVRCDARTTADGAQTHAIALFFDRIGPDEQALLDAFIAAQLAAGA
ncbi:MAG TPA: PilZ domain-containing protein [Armatimonadota bacterium]|nr:PilZ domain-containing protein [Armatimonadota bacterium]